MQDASAREKQGQRIIKLNSVPLLRNSSSYSSNHELRKNQLLLIVRTRLLAAAASGGWVGAGGTWAQGDQGVFPQAGLGEGALVGGVPQALLPGKLQQMSPNESWQQGDGGGGRCCFYSPPPRPPPAQEMEVRTGGPVKCSRRPRFTSDFCLRKEEVASWPAEERVP